MVGVDTKVVILCPAYNEEETIALTIRTLLAQTYPVTIVAIPNGCSDRTAEIARQFPIEVLELPRQEHKKSQSMNKAWLMYCQDADLVITVDADTELEPESVQQWVDEFSKDAKLSGSCARFTMRHYPKYQRPDNHHELNIYQKFTHYDTHRSKSFLTRLQRSDFSMGIDISLRRGWTCVLAGAATCFRNDVLKTVYRSDDREGPWSYKSAVEDFELTYQTRRLGYHAWVSPEVRAYTDAMKTWKALKGQRMKWLTGTIEDLISFGLNKTTYVMWAQQALGWCSVLILMAFFAIMSITLYQGSYHISSWGWLLSVGIPVLIWMKNIKHSLRIPHRDWIDVALAASVLTYEIFSWRRIGWFVQAWVSVLWEKVSGKRKDRWAMQDVAESGKQAFKGGKHSSHRVKRHRKKVLAKTG